MNIFTKDSILINDDALENSKIMMLNLLERKLRIVYKYPSNATTELQYSEHLIKFFVVEIWTAWRYSLQDQYEDDNNETCRLLKKSVSAK